MQHCYNYSHHVVCYIPTKFLSYNWKFVPFDHFPSFNSPPLTLEHRAPIIEYLDFIQLFAYSHLYIIFWSHISFFFNTFFLFSLKMLFTHIVNLQNVICKIEYNYI